MVHASQSLAATIRDADATLLDVEKVESLHYSAETVVSVCVACCATSSMPNDTVRDVAEAIKSMAVVRTVLLAETEMELADDIEIIAVPHGTKLSKIGRLADIVDTDLFCICDPDLIVDEAACRVVFQQAVLDVRAGNDVVAFGIVEGRDDGTLLSRVVAVDKWLSHRVIRRFLWAARIGMTLPGQFLILSPSLIRSIDASVDSYLDDLCLGWLARQRGVCVRRIAIVVGEEDSRRRWSSLLIQRMRWMRGITSLLRMGLSHPSIIGLLGIHYLAYHGVPIMVMVAIVWLTIANPLAGLIVFLSLASLLCACTRRSFLVIVSYLIIFPIVHVLATALWWLPMSRTMLTRR